MGQDPREAWRRLQQYAQERGGSRPNLPGGPRGFFGGAAGLILLGAGVVFVNNALFNGKFPSTCRGDSSLTPAS